MNARIKEQIEQINSGIVPEGYQKIAFGIFPCDWETNKTLGDLGQFSKGKGIPGNKLTSEGVPCVGYGDIYMKYNYHFENAQSFVGEQTAAESQKIGKGTLLFTATGETAEEIGKCVCYNGEKDIYAGGDIITFVPYVLNSLFIAYQQYQSYALRQKASFGQGHSVVHIQKDRLEKLHIAFPKSTQEQARIAEILMQWDKAIELQGKLGEAYQKLKKYCLNKMFPKQGSNVPEIRFPGFTAPWEQCKFAEVYSFASEGGTPDTNTDAYYRNGTIPFVRIEDTENKYIDSVKTFITEEGLKHSSAWLIPLGSVIFTNGATVGNVAINRIPVATKQGILGIIPNKTVTAEYLYYLLSSGFFQREVRNRQATGTFATIILKNLNEINVFVPDKAEQQKISGYLSSIDNLITLHQKKREKLVAQRKILQQYLLTGIVRV